MTEERVCEGLVGGQHAEDELTQMSRLRHADSDTGTVLLGRAALLARRAALARHRPRARDADHELGEA